MKRHIIIAFLMLPVVLMVWWFARASDRIGTPFGKQQFNPVTWRAMKHSQSRSQRARMANDLVDHHLRNGMLDTEITSLLGIQDKTWHAEEYIPPPRHDVYEYDMGQAPMDLAGQHYVLRLYFDGQGHYQRAEITRD